MVLSIMVPYFPAFGSGGMPPVPLTILMSDLHHILRSYFKQTKDEITSNFSDSLAFNYFKKLN